MLPDIDPFSSDFALDQTNPCHWPLIFSLVPTMTKISAMSFIFSLANVTIVNFQSPDLSSPYTLSACGLYLESAALLPADNSSSLPDADQVVTDPLQASALIDMSGPTNITTNYLIATPQSLVPIVPSFPVSQASNALVLATNAMSPQPHSYVAIALCVVSVQSQCPLPCIT